MDDGALEVNAGDLISDCASSSTDHVMGLTEMQLGLMVISVLAYSR